MEKLLLLALLSACALPALAGIVPPPGGQGGFSLRSSPLQTVTIDNKSPRLDVAGNIINAHDGHILYYEDKYWMVGTHYPDCKSTGPDVQDHCGWGPGPWGKVEENDFAVYSSPDMVSWTLASASILPADARPRGTLFRPKVLHAPQNEADERFVLWGNYVDMYKGGMSGMYFTAVAPRVEGPYAIKNWNITMGTGWFGNGDFNVFTDDDGKAYIAYHGYGCPKWPGVKDTPCEGVDGTHAIDLLTPDFTASSLETSGVFDIRGSEAAVMYKHTDKYYVITGTGCGFCSEGGDARPWVADSPLGPYHWTGANLNPCAHSTDPNCGLMKNGIDTDNEAHVVPAQQSFVFRLPNKSKDGEVQWIWGGDRWNSTPDHLKSHEFQTWLPFKFGPDGVPAPLKNLDSFTVDV